MSGFASKGPIDGATCAIFNSANQLVLTATTVKGAVAFGGLTAAGAYTGSCTGGTYVDEATGQTVANTTVLHSGIVIGSGGAAVMTISPLTEMAYQRAGGDASRMDAAARDIAQAFGLPASVNLLTTVPTDVNSAAAANDAAGQYGTLLAAIAQMQKDQGTSLSNVIATLAGGIGTNASGANNLNAAVASLLASAAANLSDPSKNSNPAVQGFVAATKSTLQSGVQASADTQPYVNSIVLNSTAGAVVTAPQFGQSYQLKATGGNLGTATLVATNMNCGTPSASAASISATCVMAAFGTQAGVTVQSGGVAVQGLTPSTLWYLGTSGQSCQSGAIVTSVSPTTFAYGAQSVAVTVLGCSMAAGAAMSLDGQPCALATGATASQLQFRCDVPNVRNIANTGNMVLGSYGASGSKTTAIGYTVPVVAATSASPASLVQGGNGSGNWTVNGSGLFTGMSISLGGTPCTAPGTSNAAGTQLTGVNCSNVPVSQSAATVTLAIGSASSSIALTPPVVPVINIGGASTLQVGGSIQLLPSSASGAPFTYSMASGGSNASVNASGLVTGLAVGSASVQVSQAAVAGQFTAASTLFSINVTTQTVAVLGFTSSALTVSLGAADVVNAATASCSTGGSGYAPTVTYTVTAGGALVKLTGASVALKGAGAATIQASVPAVGTCAAQAVSYVLTIQKASPSLVFASPVTSVVYGQAGPSDAVTLTAPANAGTGGPLPSTANLTLTYASGSPSVATIDSGGNITAVGAGTSVIGASSAADANYAAATATPFTFTVTKAPLTLTFALSGGLTLSTGNRNPVSNTATLAGTFGASAPSGAITYSSGDTSVATVDTSGKVTPVGAGNTSITANYAGDANYQAAAAVSYPVTVTSPAEGGGASADGMSFVYTGLPGGDLTALQNFDFGGGAKTLYWQPNLASGGIPDATNPGTDVFLKNMGYDDRIVIKVSSGVIPEPETGGTYPRVPDPYGTYPAGTTFAVSNAAVQTSPVVTSVPQNLYRGYDYVTWQQRYFTGLIGTPGGLNNLYSQYPYDQYTYYNDRAVAGVTWGKFEIKSGYLLSLAIDNGDGTFTTLYTPTVKTITLSGFPTYYNPFVSNFAFTFAVRYYDPTPYVANSAADVRLTAAGCSPYFDTTTNTYHLGYFCPFSDGAGNDAYGGFRPGYDQSGNFITFTP